MDTAEMIETVGVVGGAGFMGSGIVYVFAVAGYDVKVVEQDWVTAEAGKQRLTNALARSVEKGKLTVEAAEAAAGRVTFSSSLADLNGAELIIEAIVEDLVSKQALFAELDALMPPSTILATNTSSIRISDLASVTHRPGQVIGMHFCSPVPASKVIEVVQGAATSDATLATVQDVAAHLGKATIVSHDIPGFVVNRLLFATMLEAMRLVEKGVGTAADIDRALMLACGHPMGPLATANFAGLRTTLLVAEVLEKDDPVLYAVPQILRDFVESGRKFVTASAPVASASVPGRAVSGHGEPPQVG